MKLLNKIIHSPLLAAPSTTPTMVTRKPAKMSHVTSSAKKHTPPISRPRSPMPSCVVSPRNRVRFIRPKTCLRLRTRAQQLKAVNFLSRPPRYSFHRSFLFRRMQPRRKSVRRYQLRPLRRGALLESIKFVQRRRAPQTVLSLPQKLRYFWCARKQRALNVYGGNTKKSNKSALRLHEASLWTWLFTPRPNRSAAEWLEVLCREHQIRWRGTPDPERRRVLEVYTAFNDEAQHLHTLRVAKAIEQNCHPTEVVDAVLTSHTNMLFFRVYIYARTVPSSLTKRFARLGREMLQEDPVIFSQNCGALDMSPAASFVRWVDNRPRRPHPIISARNYGHAENEPLLWVSSKTNYEKFCDRFDSYPYPYQTVVDLIIPGRAGAKLAAWITSSKTACVWTSPLNSLHVLEVLGAAHCTLTAAVVVSIALVGVLLGSEVRRPFDLFAHRPF